MDVDRCRAAGEAELWREVASLCQEPAANGNEQASLLVGRARFYLRDLEGARRVLEPLVSGRRRADAMAILATVETSAGHSERALRLVEEALSEHRRARRADMAAEDLASPSR